MTMEEVSSASFEQSVEMLLNARTIYIVGIRSCAPLASFLAFYLHMIFDDVRLIQTSSASEIFEQMIRIGEEDVMIGISFPRYSLRTQKALEFASKRHAKVITITDSVHSPINAWSSCSLIAKVIWHPSWIPWSPAEPDQCAGGGALHETPGGRGRYTGDHGRNLG